MFKKYFLLGFVLFLFIINGFSENSFAKTNFKEEYPNFYDYDGQALTEFFDLVNKDYNDKSKISQELKKISYKYFDSKIDFLLKFYIFRAEKDIDFYTLGEFEEKWRNKKFPDFVKKFYSTGFFHYGSWESDIIEDAYILPILYWNIANKYLSNYDINNNHDSLENKYSKENLKMAIKYYNKIINYYEEIIKNHNQLKKEELQRFYYFSYIMKTKILYDLDDFQESETICNKILATQQNAIFGQNFGKSTHIEALFLLSKIKLKENNKKDAIKYIYTILTDFPLNSYGFHGGPSGFYYSLAFLSLPKAEKQFLDYEYQFLIALENKKSEYIKSKWKIFNYKPNIAKILFSKMVVISYLNYLSRYEQYLSDEKINEIVLHLSKNYDDGKKMLEDEKYQDNQIYSLLEKLKTKNKMLLKYLQSFK